MNIITKIKRKLLHLSCFSYEEYLFNNPHTAIAILDLNFNFIVVNELYAKQNGCNPEDYQTKNHFELYPNEEAEQIFRNVVTRGESYYTSARPFHKLLHPEQPVTYWDWSLVPVKNRRGRSKFLILQLINVTRHMNGICQLEESFYKAFNLSPVMMAIRELETGSFLNVNDAWTKCTGYSREEVLHKKPQEISLYPDKDPYDLLMQNEKKITNLDIRFTTKKGRIREALFSTEIIEIGGKPCMLNALVDMTQRKAMEKELGRLDRLSLIGQMAAGIGHEIRNPMTTIRGFLQILSMKENYKQELDYFKLMISEVDRANSIITEFLALSKTRSENLSMGNLNSIIETISPLLQAQALQLDKRVKFSPGQITDTFLCEKEIRQLLLNMVTNGLEASPVGSTVSITTKQENEWIMLIIKDSGPGIDSQIVHRLGTPFLTTKPHGTGLGLAICYNIMERHAGDIQVETGASGTTFIMRFPACLCEKIGA